MAGRWQSFKPVSTKFWQALGVRVMQGPRPQDASRRAARELLGTADAAAARRICAYRRQARRLHPDISLEPDAAGVAHRDPTVVVDTVQVRPPDVPISGPAPTSPGGP